MGLTHPHGDRCYGRALDKGHRALVIHAQKSMPGLLYTVHPVERHQLHTELVGKEVDLGLNV